MADVNGGSPGSLRERNRVRVVDALRGRGPASRSDLSRLTGLSRTTVGSVVADLQARGLVVEQEADARRQPGRGRPPVFLRLDPSAGVAVGVNFDHDEVRVALADLSSTVLGEARRDVDVDHSATDALEAAVEMVRALQREADVADEQLIGAGVGLPGPIDHRTGTIASADILPGWAGLQTRAALSRSLGMPVELENDANLGALAEASFGAGRGRSDVVYVQVGAGVGAGLVLGGRLVHGTAGLAGEIGHVQVRPDGVRCRCGNRGCLETVGSASAVRALLRPRVGREPTTDELLDLLAAGDPVATGLVADAGAAIGRVLADVCNVLNPERIVVGGELAEAGEPLLAAIRAAIELSALPGAAALVEVAAAELGERAELLGALALAIASADTLRPRGLLALAGAKAAAPAARRRSAR